MAAVAVTRGLLPTRPFVRTSRRMSHRARREAFSALYLLRICLHRTTQRRTRRTHVPNPLLLFPAAPPHHHTITIIRPLRPNYARVRTMHGRLMSAPTHSNTFLICYKRGMHPAPLTLPLTSSRVLAVTRMMLPRDGVGSPPVSAGTLCLEFRRHPTSALPTPRPLISTRTDWPERVVNQPQPAFIDTTIEVGNASPSICRRLVSRTQALCEMQTLRRIPPYPKSESVTCIDAWTHSRVVRAVVPWIMSALKTWLSCTNETVNSESSCAGNEVSVCKKRIRAFVGGFVNARAIVLVLTFIL
jgi:hypothetical protein